MDKPFKVARRYAATPWDLVREQQALPLLRSYYQPMTPFIKAVGYGLFALTTVDPDDFQEVEAGELLEVIEVARHPTGSGGMAFHGQHYADAFEALERLFNVAVPMKTKRVWKEGRRWVEELSLIHI